MFVTKRLLTITITVLLSTSTGFGGAIVPGFDSISDGRNDDGTYTTGGCNNSADGGTCPGTLVPIGFSVDFLGRSPTRSTSTRTETSLLTLLWPLLRRSRLSTDSVRLLLRSSRM